MVSPPRPADTYLPANCTSVAISTTVETSDGSVTRSALVTQPARVEELVRLVNGLRWGRTVGRLPGPLITSSVDSRKESATLTFHTAARTSITVVARNLTASVWIDGVQLADQRLGVLHAALAVMARS